MSDTKKATRRKHRTPEEIIADLQAKIKAVEARAANKQLKKSAALKKASGLIRSIDSCVELATEESNTPLHHALTAAREPIAAFLESEGMKLPKARKPRGRKPKGA